VVVPTWTDDRERWLELMKNSIAELSPRFSMQRAVIEYVGGYYRPAHVRASG
jgi:glucan phosphorylase